MITLDVNICVMSILFSFVNKFSLNGTTLLILLLNNKIYFYFINYIITHYRVSSNHPIKLFTPSKLFVAPDDGSAIIQYDGKQQCFICKTFLLIQELDQEQAIPSLGVLRLAFNWPSCFAYPLIVVLPPYL